VGVWLKDIGRGLQESPKIAVIAEIEKARPLPLINMDGRGSEW
jgi:hypothetical protein